MSALEQNKEHRARGLALKSGLIMNYFFVVFLISWYIMMYLYHNSSKNLDVCNILKMAFWFSLFKKMRSVKNVFFVGFNDSIFLSPCSFVISVVLRSCLGFFSLYRPLLLKICARFLSFFCIAFYRYRVGFTVLPFYHFIVLSSCLHLCTNFLSLFVP